MEIDTESLTEDAYKVDEFAGKVTLLVEAQVSAPSQIPALALPPSCKLRGTMLSMPDTSMYSHLGGHSRACAAHVQGHWFVLCVHSFSMQAPKGGAPLQSCMCNISATRKAHSVLKGTRHMHTEIFVCLPLTSLCGRGACAGGRLGATSS